MIKRPLIPVVICYSLGLLSAPLFVLPLKTISLFLASLFILLVYLFYRNKKIPATAVSLLVFFVLGIIFVYPRTNPEFDDFHIVNYAGGAQVNIEGVVYRNPERTSGGITLYLKDLFLHTADGSRKLSGRLRVSIREPGKAYCYGDRIRFFCYLRRPSNFNNPGSFDYIQYLSFKKIFVTAFLADDSGVVKTGEAFGNFLFLKADAYRAGIRSLIDKVAEPPAADVLKALILGDRGSIPDEVRERFVKLGISHLLAISGLHVGIVAFISYLFLNLVFRSCHKVLLYVDVFRLSVFLSILPILFYCFIAGFHLPTLRAAIMVVFYMTALVLGRKQDILSILFAAGFVILIFMPAAIFEVSFQLSFAAVFFIVILVPALKKAFKRHETEDFPEKKRGVKDRLLVWMGDSSAATAAAVFGTAPLIIIFFHRFSFSGFFANLLIVPFIGFIVIPLGLLATVIFPVSFSFAGIIFKWAGFIVEKFLYVIHIGSEHFAWEILLPVPYLWETAVFYLLLILFPVFVKRKKTVLFLTAAAVFILIELSLCFYQGSHAGLLKITFLDVGDGDAALIEFPEKKVMLVDGGGFRDDRFDVGKEVIAPVLHKKRIRKVDYVVLSHPHMDHMGGLPYIIENFRVEELWLSGQKSYLPAYKRMMLSASEGEVKLKQCSASTLPLTIEGVQVEVISPEDKDLLFSSSYEDINNNSLVLKIIFGNVSFLLTGDILGAREEKLKEKEVSLLSTIIKVPHHGSKGSSTKAFVEKVSPEIAVVSCRMFGEKAELPERVVRTYKDLGAKILRTDRNGAVEIKTDGNRYSVYCFKSSND